MHVALIDMTSKEIHFAEEIEDAEEAKTRARQLHLQAELNAAGCNPDADRTAGWQAYLGKKPFAFPEDAA